MRIYTSYFGNLKALHKSGVVPVSIALWKPKWYKGLSLKEVAPKAYMLNDSLTEDEYVGMYYRNVLYPINAYSILDKLKAMTNGKDCALLCYEKPGDFCHRNLLAKWLKDQTGIEIEEFESAPEVEPQQSLF